MRNFVILKVLTRVTQVLSLSLEDNLKPKYLYLVNDLHNEVKPLTKYPMYLSLSLEQRIRSYHRFLVSLKKAPKGPFPLSSLVPTDECFCQQWAGTTLERYLHSDKAHCSLTLQRHTKGDNNPLILSLFGTEVISSSFNEKWNKLLVLVFQILLLLY